MQPLSPLLFAKTFDKRTQFNTKVHTPNKRRLGASERLRESQQEEEEEQEDLLLGSDMVLNPSDAGPPAGTGKVWHAYLSWSRPEYTLLCERSHYFSGEEGWLF